MVRPFAPAALAALGLALAPTAVPACTCRGGSGGHEPPPEAEARRDFGDLAVPSPGAQDAAKLLALARSVVEHKGRDAAPPPPRVAGRRVVLAAYLPGAGEPVVATAVPAAGGNLADAVVAAAEQLAPKVKDAAAARLELDVPAPAGRESALSVATVEEDEELPLGDVGLEGVLVA